MTFIHEQKFPIYKNIRVKCFNEESNREKNESLTRDRN